MLKYDSILNIGEKICPGCISETIRCRNLILVTNKLLGTLVRGVGVQPYGVTLI